MQEFEAEAMPHLADLFRTASRVLNDQTKADDVVQDAYLQAWRSWDRFENGTNCRAWLYKILFHSIQHFRRKFQNARQIDSEDETLERTVAWEPPVHDSLQDRDILEALDAIPADYRAVVILADVEEFAYKEIAQIVGIPIGTVMSRLSRGRARLRQHLANTARAYGVLRQPASG
jgi:RNA polymerase sigma-70 factor (ECF subfamily)